MGGGRKPRRITAVSPELLYTERTEHLSRSVWLSRSGDGGISIEGQDLGDLSDFFGPGAREYEWAQTVSAKDLSRLTKALGGGGRRTDVAELVKARFSGPRHGDFAEFCEEHDIEISFWSRVGD
jgi:hypothetical protein